MGLIEKEIIIDKNKKRSFEVLPAGLFEDLRGPGPLEVFRIGSLCVKMDFTRTFFKSLL